MIVLIGPTCSGKDTIAQEIVRQAQYKRILEATTRNIRAGERNGVNYWYVDTPRYLNMLEEGELIGSMQFPRIQNGEQDYVYYGTIKKDFDTYGAKSILTTNIGAAQKLKEYAPEKIWLCKLSIKDNVQYQRLRKRGDEEAEIKKRMASDKEVLSGVHADFEIDNSYSSIWCIANCIINEYEKYTNSLIDKA